MSQQQELDRNEAATPHKLAEARKRGQVSKSADLVSALVMAVAAVVFYATGWDKLVQLVKFDALMLSYAKAASPGTHGANWLSDLLGFAIRDALGLILPSLAFLMVAAIIANMGQTGGVWSWHPLRPDWQRLNPAAGFRRVWSLRTLFDGARAIVKLVVLCIAIGLGLRDLAPQFQQLTQATPYGHAGLLVQDLASMAVKIAVALCVIALIDLGFSRREFSKNMRMSRREVRDEHKQREGDPRIRSRLRELRRDMLRRSKALQRTATADLVVTNPTHIAVALSYRHGEMAAPVLVCKGAGILAGAMRTIASRHHVPVMRSPLLARALHAQTPIDAPIPPSLYADVARLMVWLKSAQAASARASNR